jgi:hypothetical protein
MKRIHFDNLGKPNLWHLLIIFSLIFMLIVILEPFEFENPKIYKYIISCGLSLQAIYFGRNFWHKNYVQWNKKGANIRINSFWGKSLSFDQVKATELNEKTLTITKNNGNKITIDLNEIADSDSQILTEVIIKNTIANRVDGQ